MSGPPGTYYFGLVIGSDIKNLFFTGIYGTNTGVNGFFSGGTVAVPGWIPGTSTNFIIAGWQASTLGHDFQLGWVSDPSFHPNGGFGEVVGRGISGDGGVNPALNPFNNLTSGAGFFLYNNIPEPSAFSLIAVGAGFLVLCRRRQKANTFAVPKPAANNESSLV